MAWNYLDELKKLRQSSMAREVPYSPAQGGTQVPMSPSPTQATAAQVRQDEDPVLRAMLEIEGLSPGEKKRSRKQAVIDQLRGYALSGDPTPHWTGALAKGVAGLASAYGQKKMDPEYDAAGEERRRRMREIFGGL
jgi:hypothetical protein